MAKRNKIEDKDKKGEIVVTGVAIEISEEAFDEFLRTMINGENPLNTDKKKSRKKDIPATRKSKKITR